LKIQSCNPEGAWDTDIIIFDNKDLTESNDTIILTVRTDLTNKNKKMRNLKMRILQTRLKMHQ